MWRFLASNAVHIMQRKVKFNRKILKFFLFITNILDFETIDDCGSKDKPQNTASFVNSPIVKALFKKKFRGTQETFEEVVNNRPMIRENTNLREAKNASQFLHGA